jgi:hypothetical protein
MAHFRFALTLLPLSSSSDRVAVGRERDFKFASIIEKTGIYKTD